MLTVMMTVMGLNCNFVVILLIELNFVINGWPSVERQKVALWKTDYVPGLPIRPGTDSPKHM